MTKFKEEPKWVGDYNRSGYDISKIKQPTKVETKTIITKGASPYDLSKIKKVKVRKKRK